MTRRPDSYYYRGTNAPGSAAREAREQKTPFAFRAPKALSPGQAYRQIRVRGTEDADDAKVRARALPWWSDVVYQAPVRASSAWWVWIVRVDDTRGVP